MSWSLFAIKSLQPMSNESNKNKLFFGWMSIKLHQWTPGSFSLPVLNIANGYLPFLLLIIS